MDCLCHILRDISVSLGLEYMFIVELSLFVRKNGICIKITDLLRMVHVESE